MTFSSKRTGKTDFAQILQRLGIKSGSSIMVHSSLVSLGLYIDRQETLIEALCEAVGPLGNVIIPSFSYDVFNNRIFDPNRSCSLVGVLGDLANKFEGSVRSWDPAFSVTAIGPDKHEIVEMKVNRAFGTDSIYERLYEYDVNFVFLGVDYKSLPYFMHMEAMLELPYRYPKEFTGKILRDDLIANSSYVHYVRDLDLNFKTDRTKIGYMIDSIAQVTKTPLPCGEARIVACREIDIIVRSAVSKDTHALIKFL